MTMKYNTDTHMLFTIACQEAAAFSYDENPQRSLLRTFVRTAYSLQKLRISTGNRVVASFKVKLGQQPSKPESELSAEAQRFLDDLRINYKRISDAMTIQRVKSFKGEGLITTYGEFCMCEMYFQAEASEVRHFKNLEQILESFPIWSNYLKDVPGIGPALAGIIISEFNPYRATYPSCFWAYAGLDVGPDGKGRNRSAAHLIDRDYLDKDGETQTKKSVTFNPWVKTKLLGVAGPSFLRGTRVRVDGVRVSSSERIALAVAKGFAKDYKMALEDPAAYRESVLDFLRSKGYSVVVETNKYAKSYYDYKSRLNNHPEHKTKTPIHKHRMALRYMVKRFLLDLYVEWRTIEGLPVSSEYSEGKLGMVHGEPKN